MSKANLASELACLVEVCSISCQWRSQGYNTAVRMSGFKIKDYVQMGFYDIKSTRAERKLTSEQVWIGETPGSLNGQETTDKVGPDNSLKMLHKECFSALLLSCCSRFLAIYQLIYQE